MKSMILLSDDSPKELQAIVVERKKLRNNYELRVSALQDDLFLIHLQKKVWGKPVGGNLVIDCGTRGCWIAYTDESGYFVKRVLEPFFNGLYPYVARIYLNYIEIQKFLGAIKEAYQGSSVVTHVAYKRQLRSRKGEPKETHPTMGSWSGRRPT